MLRSSGVHSNWGWVAAGVLTTAATAWSEPGEGPPRPPDAPAVVAVAGTLPERASREAWVMGTRALIIAEAADRRRAERATEAALREIERLEGVLSSWDPGSELGLANAAVPGRPVAVSEELALVLGEAETWAVRTGRAFDPTVGALVDVWDLRGGGRTPTDDELAAARAATGPGAVRVVAGRNVVRSSGRAWIDSGAFGKGAALRAAAEVARKERVDRLLVDLGGQLWAEAGADAAWPIDVAHPRQRDLPVARLEVHGVSVATSGASERPGHLLDPRSGRPAPAWGSVTVVSADPVEADVLSTALYVMGPSEGLAWARAHGIAALFLESTPEGLRSTATSDMERWLSAPSEASASRD